MTGDELESLTFRHMPEVLFGRLLRAVFAAHQLASENCRNEFAETEAMNVRGYYRRAKLEGFMRDTADMVAGVESRVVRGDGNWNHTELRSGPVVLTASSVAKPCGPVDIAEFRETLARDNAQRLWHEPGDVPPADAPLYALLLHSKSAWVTPEEWRDFGHLPGSAYLAFPSPDLGSYVHEVNLFDRFPEVIEAHKPQSWDEAATVSYLRNARRTLSG